MIEKQTETKSFIWHGYAMDQHGDNLRQKWYCKPIHKDMVVLKLLGSSWSAPYDPAVLGDDLRAGDEIIVEQWANTSMQHPIVIGRGKSSAEIKARQMITGSIQTVEILPCTYIRDVPGIHFHIVDLNGTEISVTGFLREGLKLNDTPQELVHFVGRDDTYGHTSKILRLKLSETAFLKASFCFL